MEELIWPFLPLLSRCYWLIWHFLKWKSRRHGHWRPASASMLGHHDRRWSCHGSNTERGPPDPSPEWVVKSFIIIIRKTKGTGVRANHILRQGRNLLGLVFDADLVLRQAESSNVDETDPRIWARFRCLIASAATSIEVVVLHPVGSLSHVSSSSSDPDWGKSSSVVADICWVCLFIDDFFRVAVDLVWHSRGVWHVAVLTMHSGSSWFKVCLLVPWRVPRRCGMMLEFYETMCL